MLDNTPNHLSKFKQKQLVEVNDELRGTYTEDNQIRLKTSMLRSSLCDYSDAHILVKGTITVVNTAAQGQLNNAPNKKIIFKNCAPFTNCISTINNTQGDDAHDIDVVIQMYSLIGYSDNYSKTSEILWEYCRYVLAVDAHGVIVNFNADNATTDSFKTKEKITGQTGDYGRKDVEIMIPLKHLSNLENSLNTFN